MVFATLAVTTLISASAVLSASTPNPVRLRDLAKRGGTVAGPVINTDFPDPGLILPNGQPPWYAYSTSSVHGKVPYAISEDFVEWTPVQGDALPNPGSWVDSSNSGIWAPDVRQITSNSYVMYYTAFSAADGNHCIGAATSSTPAGPFTPQSAPILCDSSGGGVIDASGFGSPRGKGQSTPIFIQHLGADGFTLQGSATQLITNDPVDGGVVEAPSMVYWDGWYYLFFSSNSYNTLYYDISYAVATSATGPFTKVQAPNAPLLTSGKCGTAGPGGATVINVLDQYVNAVFHSDINGQDASGGRAMWQITGLTLSNGVATVNC
ncbi:Arabinanase/levansucrase/invertase superfamily protein [Mycena sanguinolenta]|uniref:Arabinanase/levansucrase/invertase superfamily protein n=1 Tax=Mycena sanguinolenta TaxID=230812 RepID=A0A8H6XNU1_9AGAR|nr:Arabinanase/levansucrase/invertase superfamily protein [Mycena sanguinolenta]